MRICTILKEDQHRVAIQTSESSLGIITLQVFGIRSVSQLITRGAEARKQIEAAPNSGQLEQIDIDSVRIAPPIVLAHPRCCHFFTAL